VSGREFGLFIRHLQGPSGGTLQIVLIFKTLARGGWRRYIRPSGPPLTLSRPSERAGSGLSPCRLWRISPLACLEYRVSIEAPAADHHRNDRAGFAPVCFA
jgi:hypothetical protein